MNRFIKPLRNETLCANREEATTVLEEKLQTLTDGEVCVVSYGDDWDSAKSIFGIVRSNEDKLNYTIYDPEKLQEAIDANTNLIINAHASISFSASPSVIEKGATTVITFIGNASFMGSTDLVSEMIILYDDYVVATTEGKATKSPITYGTALFDDVTYTLKAVIGSVTKTKTASVKAYYPIYMIASAETPTADTITSGTKQTISSTATGTRTITTEDGDYVWLCVPSGVTVPTKATMAGVEFTLETPNVTVSNVSVNGASITYTLVRSYKPMSANTLTIKYE